MTPSITTRPPDVKRERIIGGDRYVLKAWLDTPLDWMRVAEWDLAMEEEAEFVKGLEMEGACGACGGEEEEG